MLLGGSVEFGDAVHVGVHLAKTLSDGGVGHEALDGACAVASGQTVGLQELVRSCLGRRLRRLKVHVAIIMAAVGKILNLNLLRAALTLLSLKYFIEDLFFYRWNWLLLFSNLQIVYCLIQKVLLLISLRLRDNFFRLVSVICLIFLRRNTDNRCLSDHSSLLALI